MIDQMRELGRPDPQFEERGEFIVTFLRSSLSEGSGKEVLQKKTTPSAEASPTRKKRQKLAMRYVHTHGFITDERYQALTGTPKSVALRDLEALAKQGSLRTISQKSGGRYYRL
jgi:predicted HTH transcriptional regulator